MDKNKKIATWVIIIGTLVSIIYFTSSEKTPTPQEARKARIEKQFSPSDGSHINLTKLIKESMNDPESYENVNTNYIDEDSIIVVSQSYTGKNAFGGRVKGYVRAKVDTLGNVLSILEQK